MKIYEYNDKELTQKKKKKKINFNMPCGIYFTQLLAIVVRLRLIIETVKKTGRTSLQRSSLRGTSSLKGRVQPKLIDIRYSIEVSGDIFSSTQAFWSFTDGK